MLALGEKIFLFQYILLINEKLDSKIDILTLNVFD